MITAISWESLSLITLEGCIYCIIRVFSVAVVFHQFITVWSFIARTIRGPCANRVEPNHIRTDDFPLIREATIRRGDSRGMCAEEINQIPIIRVTEPMEDCCAVCMQSMQKGERVRLLPCLHPYHIKCIDKWLCIRSNCPLCKREVRVPPVFHHIPHTAHPQTLSASESNEPQEIYRIFIKLSILLVLLLFAVTYVVFGVVSLFLTTISLAFAILSTRFC